MLYIVQHILSTSSLDHAELHAATKEQLQPRGTSASSNCAHQHIVAVTLLLRALFECNGYLWCMHAGCDARRRRGGKVAVEAGVHERGCCAGSLRGQPRAPLAAAPAPTHPALCSGQPVLFVNVCPHALPGHLPEDMLCPPSMLPSNILALALVRWPHPAANTLLQSLLLHTLLTVHTNFFFACCLSAFCWQHVAGHLFSCNIEESLFEQLGP